MPITFPHLRSTEPVALAEAGRVLVLSTIALGIGFGWWHLTAEQIGLLLGEYTALSVLLSVIARAKSTPNSKVAITHDQVALLEKATPPPGPVPVAAAVDATPKKRPARKAPAAKDTPGS